MRYCYTLLQIYFMHRAVISNVYHDRRRYHDSHYRESIMFSYTNYILQPKERWYRKGYCTLEVLLEFQQNYIIRPQPCISCVGSDLTSGSASSTDSMSLTSSTSSSSFASMSSLSSSTSKPIDSSMRSRSLIGSKVGYSDASVTFGVDL